MSEATERWTTKVKETDSVLYTEYYLDGERKRADEVLIALNRLGTIEAALADMEDTLEAWENTAVSTTKTRIAECNSAYTRFEAASAAVLALAADCSARKAVR